MKFLYSTLMTTTGRFNVKIVIMLHLAKKAKHIMKVYNTPMLQQSANEKCK